MILQKILALFVQITSRLMRCGSDSSPIGEGLVSHNHLSLLGPRVLVLRDGKLLRLTGVFSVTIVKDERDRVRSCKPFLLTRQNGDQTYFGDAAQRKYQELYPQQDRGEPMFTDGEVSFG